MDHYVIFKIFVYSFVDVTGISKFSQVSAISPDISIINVPQCTRLWLATDANHLDDSDLDAEAEVAISSYASDEEFETPFYDVDTRHPGLEQT